MQEPHALLWVHLACNDDGLRTRGADEHRKLRCKPRAKANTNPGSQSFSFSVGITTVRVCVGNVLFDSVPDSQVVNFSNPRWCKVPSAPAGRQLDPQSRATANPQGRDTAPSLQLPSLQMVSTRSSATSIASKKTDVQIGIAARRHVPN